MVCEGLRFAERDAVLEGSPLNFWRESLRAGSGGGPCGREGADCGGGGAGAPGGGGRRSV